MISNAIGPQPIRVIPTGLPEVRSVAWRPGTHLLAVGGKDGSLVLIDADDERLATSDLVGHGADHEGNVESLAWTADGNYLLSAGWDGTVRVWSPDGSLLDTIVVLQQTLLLSVTVVDDPETEGYRFATSDLPGDIKIWRLNRAGRITTNGAGALCDGVPISYPGEANFVAWDREGRRLAFGGGAADHSVVVVDTDTGDCSTLLGHEAPVLDGAWSPDGRLATVGDDSTLWLWDADAGQAESTTPLDGPGWSVRWAPSGGDLLAASSNSATVYRTSRAAIERRVGGDGTSVVRGIAVNSTGDVIAAGDESSTISIWAGADRTDIDTGLLGVNNDLRWSSDDLRLAAVYSGGGVAIVDGARDVRRLPAVTDVEAVSVAWSPDGSMIAVGHLDGTTRVWDVAAEEVEITLDSTTGERVSALAFSPAGDRLIAGTWRDVHVWDLEAATQQMIVEGSGQARSVVWSDADIIRIATDHALTWQGPIDGDLTLTSLQDLDLGAPTESEWSPDGRLLLVASSFGAPRLVDPVERAFIGDPLAGLSTEGEVAAWSADGTTIATTDRRGLVKVWRAVFEDEACAIAAGLLPTGAAAVLLSDGSTPLCANPGGVDALAAIPVFPA